MHACTSINYLIYKPTLLQVEPCLGGWMLDAGIGLHVDCVLVLLVYIILNS